MPETRQYHQIDISLHDGGHIVLCTESPEERVPFSGFAALLCLGADRDKREPADVTFITPEELPEGRHTLESTRLTEIAYVADWSRIVVAGWKQKPRRTHYYPKYVWQTGLIYAGTNAILRGEKAVLVHSTVLETDRGAVLLFGESGMGKSTASARWREQGGKCVSDDMALLDFSGGETVYVRRMPTWSACRLDKNQWNYPVEEELPLACVLGLGRSESGHDEIVELSPAQYFAQCYRSIFYWNLFYANNLPDAMKGKLTDRIGEFTRTITGKYPPRALLTVLEGDLRSVIEEYLQTQ
jgi:hypothetical protein